MVVKHKRTSKRRTKRTSKRRTKRSKSTPRHKTQRHKTHRHMRGGNYETDITTRTLEGTATKPLNKFVVAMPGRGTMSGTAYVQLMEDLDRNGNRAYD
jgi:hypothetical protein